MNENQKACFNKRVLPIVGRVGDVMYDSISILHSEYILAGSPDITVIIDSGGGDVGYGLDCFDLVQNYPGKTTGIVLCQAHSMAAVILQGCDVRLCACHANVMIHHISQNQVSLDVLEDSTGVKLKKLHQTMKNRQQFIYDILTNRTKKSLDVIRDACVKEERLIAKDAKEFGLIDEILTREDMKQCFRPDLLTSP